MLFDVGAPHAVRVNNIAPCAQNLGGHRIQQGSGFFALCKEVIDRCCAFSPCSQGLPDEIDAVVKLGIATNLNAIDDVLYCGH